MCFGLWRVCALASAPAELLSHAPRPLARVCFGLWRVCVRWPPQEMVELLVRAKANTEIKDVNGNTARMVAEKKGFKAIVDVLAPAGGPESKKKPQAQGAGSSTKDKTRR